MIMETLGRLADGQSLTAGSVVSSNVIDIGAAGLSDLNNMGDVWYVITTDVAATTADAITIDLCVGDNADMTSGTPTVIDRQYIAAPSTDVRTDTVGNYLHRATLPYEVWSVANNLGSTFTYLGLWITLAGSQTVTLSVAITPHAPPTDFNTQVIRSNVSTPT
jgi:hypothetical protein